MSTDDKDIQDRLERIRTRVDNWERGEGYRPSELPQDAPVHDVIFLLKHISDLEVEARDKGVVEDRHNAPLEECESSHSREYTGNGSELPPGTIVIDCQGDSWQRGTTYWVCAYGLQEARLAKIWGPYTIAYTPKEKS